MDEGYTVSLSTLVSRLLPDSALPFNLDKILEKLDNDIEFTGGEKEWTPWRMKRSDEVGVDLNRIAEAVSKQWDIPLKRKYWYGLEDEGYGPDAPSLCVIPLTYPVRTGNDLDNLLLDVPWSKLMVLADCFNTEPFIDLVRNTFIHQENRLFIIALFCDYFTLNIYIHDRSGIVKSSVEDIIENKKDFLRFAIGILFVEEKYLGFDPSMEEIDGRRYIYVNPSPSESPVKLEIKKTISRQNGTYSEGTTLWLAQGCLKDKDDINGTIEREFIVKDFWSVVIDGSKGRKISERLEETGYTSHIVSWECIGESTGMVRDGGKKCYFSALDRCWFDESPSLPDNREHIRIVTSTIGELVDDLKTSEELLTTFLNLFLMIIDLYTDHGILIRDISKDNLLLVETPNGRRQIRLIDCHLAVDVVDDQLTRPYGTAAYMAIDAFLRYRYEEKSFRYRYYHDLESVFYVLLWILLERKLKWYEERGENLSALRDKSDILRIWDTSKPDDMIKTIKIICIKNSIYFVRSDILDPPAPEFKYLTEYVKKLHRLLLFVDRFSSDDERTSSREDELFNRNIQDVRERIISIHAEALITEVESTEGTGDKLT